jgi:hypothetical protein
MTAPETTSDAGFSDHPHRRTEREPCNKLYDNSRAGTLGKILLRGTQGRWSKLNFVPSQKNIHGLEQGSNGRQTLLKMIRSRKPVKIQEVLKKGNRHWDRLFPSRDFFSILCQLPMLRRRNYLFWLRLWFS